MREIKFRAWNGEKYSEPFTFKDLIPTVWFVGDMDEDRVIEIPGLRESIDDDSLIFEQYTGQKDRDGREICEGDIIKHRMNNSAIGIVEFNIDMGAFRVRHITKPNEDEYGKHISWWLTTAPLGEYVSNEVNAKAKIIGNMHENPELLKGAQ